MLRPVGQGSRRFPHVRRRDPVRPGGQGMRGDPKVFRFGTVFTIPGMGDYVAHDTGRLIKGNHIDILLPDHSAAIQFGRRVYPLEFVTD